MILADGNIRPSLGGHEKFVFRHGWLKKGTDAAAADPGIFAKDDALVILGVGKNMVRSIRHWCLATGLLDDVRIGSQHQVRRTQLAELLISDEGWDPYLEDTGTLWLLHWQLVSSLTRGFTWHLTFSAYYEAEFTKKQLAAYIERQLEQRGVVTTTGLIENDVDCCLRSYARAGRNKAGGFAEENLDCPLTELDLLRFTPEDNIYRFNIGPKITLPVQVFGYALLTVLPALARNRQTVAVDDCIYQPGSPGQAFKLDENSVIEYLEELEGLTHGKVRLQETAGLRQLYLHETADGWLQSLAIELLDRYYARF